MSIKTYIVDASNKISISHTYADSNAYQLRASDNIVEIDIAKGADDPAQFAKYTLISFGKNIINIAPHCCYKFTALQEVSFGTKTKSIGAYAFFMCQSLAEINIPDSVEFIGENAFQQCTSLQSVSLPQHVIAIKDYAFSNSGVQNIDVVADSTFGVNVFSNCNSLQTAKISGALTENTFSNCVSLSKVQIGDGISTIPENCFYGCSNLLALEFANANALTSIQSGAFNGCSSLESFEIKNMPLAYIGSNAFYGMAMTTLELPATIKSPTQLDPNFLAGTNVKTLKFLGMSYDDMWKEHTSFSSFGSSVGLEMEMVASNGKKYGLDDTGLKKLDITAVVLIVAMGENIANAKRMSLLKDITYFTNEIDKAYKNDASLVKAKYILSDPSYKNRNAVANASNIDAYFQKAVDTGADLLLFLFSDHGVNKNLCIYNSDNTGDSTYSYDKLYNQFKKFKYVFAQLDCCYPNSATTATIDSFKQSGTKALVWTGSATGQVTFNTPNGHQLAVLINKYFSASYSWATQFDKIKDKQMGDIYEGVRIVNKIHKYNYNDFPESSPIFRISV